MLSSRRERSYYSPGCSQLVVLEELNECDLTNISHLVTEIGDQQLLSFCHALQNTRHSTDTKGAQQHQLCYGKGKLAKQYLECPLCDTSLGQWWQL